MESARKPQLSDLRQRRLAYFDQKFSPSPPSEPKPASVTSFASNQTPNGPVDQDGKKTSRKADGTNYSKTGAIPKSHKKGNQRFSPFDVDVSVSRPINHSASLIGSNGFSYQLVADKKKSTNQRLSAQEFEIHVPDDVEELFKTNGERLRTTGRAPREKVDNALPTVPVQDNSFEAASMDYERRLINHLQRPDRHGINDQIRNADISLRNCKENDEQHRNDILDSRKKHLKRFMYRQDDEVASAVKAASEHNALYAENILHQMGQVRKLRAQVHGELMSGFSEQVSRLNPAAKVKNESQQFCSSGDEEAGFLLASKPSIQNRSVGKPSFERKHSSDIGVVCAAEEGASDDHKSLLSVSANHAAEKEERDNVHENVPDDAVDDDSDSETTFDLGALQEAAKQGDDILRKYIQSLSKNLKKKQSKDTIGVASEIVSEPIPGGMESDKDQHFVSEMASSQGGNSEDLSVDCTEDREQGSSIAQVYDSETPTELKRLKGMQYKPKVSQPTVTSRELESLGLFSDLTNNGHNPLGHTADQPAPLESHPDQTGNTDLRVEQNVELEGSVSDDENLGLSTHRPQQRPFSPLKQVYVNSGKQLDQTEDEPMLNPEDTDSADSLQKHQHCSDNSLSDLSKSGLSTQAGHTQHKQLELPVEHVDPHSWPKEEEDTNNDVDQLFSVGSCEVHHGFENQTSSTEQSEGGERQKPPPSYDKLFANPKVTETESIPFPHPLGTEVGNFLCSEQSTDSDQDQRAHKNLATGSLLIRPKPPQTEKRTIGNTKRYKPKDPVSSKNRTPRQPKTPERHVNGIREHHERDRENRRQLSSRKSQLRETKGEVSRLEKSTSPVNGSLKRPNSREEVHSRIPSEGGNNFKNADVLKVEELFMTSHQEKSLMAGPSGDAPTLSLQKRAAKFCPDCSSLNVRDNAGCEVCGADIRNLSAEPLNSEIPPFETHLIEPSAGGSVTGRTHLTTGSAWDIEISAQTEGSDIPRKGEDSESTVMGKIASFVPKLTSNGGGDFVRQPSFNEIANASRPQPVDEVGAGEASHLFGDLPDRVDSWLEANETGRLENKADRFSPPTSPDRVIPHHQDRLQQSSGEDEAEHQVTFDLVPQEDPRDYLLHQNGHISSSDEYHANIKPLPSRSGPQRSRQGMTRPKSASSKSRTSQLIEQPMFNRRWATSSSTWGTRRSTVDSLQVAAGQRSSVLDSTPVSISPAMQRKRPLSAKHEAPPLKSDSEPKVRGQRARPQSANWKSRASKDSSRLERSAKLKEDFLTVNSAKFEGGLASRALNSSHSIPPLTLQLICESPRGGEGISIWELLPDEILLQIFSHLSYQDLVHCAVSCSRFHRIAMDDSLWKTIRLHKRQVTDFWLTQIGERHPVSLSLTQCHGNIVTENGLRNLFRSCSDTLQELNVSGCTGGELTGDSLLLHASRCQQLTSLDASWCQATDNGLSAISDSCQRLTSLCLNGSQSVSDECLGKVIKKHGKSVRILEVLGCVQLSPETLQLIGRECCHLHTLNIGQCYKVTDECVSQLASHLRNLKHLDLRGCKQIRDNCVRKIVRNCKRLETLVLANCTHITNAAIVEIATYLPTIRSLDVSGCKKVNNEGVRALATCCHYLTSLDVSSTGVDNKSVLALANYCNKTLESVRLNCCKDITEAAIIKLLKNGKKLKTLHLYGVKGLRNLGVLRLQYPCLQFE